MGGGRASSGSREGGREGEGQGRNSVDQWSEGGGNELEGGVIWISKKNKKKAPFLRSVSNQGKFGVISSHCPPHTQLESKGRGRSFFRVVLAVHNGNHVSIGKLLHPASGLCSGVVNDVWCY